MERIVTDVHAAAAEPAAHGAVARLSLLAAVRDFIGTELARDASRVVGTDEWRTRSALDMLLRAVVRHLANRSATLDGAAQVFAELGSPRIESDLLATVDRLTAEGPGERGEDPDEGREAAQTLLGRRTEEHVLNIALTAGLTADATWRLLGFASPLVHAAVRDHVRDRGLDSEALRNLLLGEYPQARSKRRYQLRSAVAAATGRALRFAREAYARGVVAVARWDHRALAGGIVAVGAVVALSVWLGAGPTPEATGTGSGGAGHLLERANGSMPDAGQSAGLNGLAPFLSGGEPDLEYVFVLDGVQFDPASATLRSTSNAQLAQLARVLTDFPEARLTIEAHEVAAGAEEARARALAVRAAIAALGVQPSRMRHAGVNGASRSSVEVRVTRE